MINQAAVFESGSSAEPFAFRTAAYIALPLALKMKKCSHGMRVAPAASATASATTGTGRLRKTAV
jgi:hypothetical protein